jgi:hypothetical protein
MIFDERIIAQLVKKLSFIEPEDKLQRWIEPGTEPCRKLQERARHRWENNIKMDRK